MNNTEFFSIARPHFKGNLHAHSTVSDGQREPAEVVELYHRLGYDFVALTEHDVFSVWKEYGGPEFLVIPGIEASGESPASFQRHHVLGIGGHTAHGEVFDRKGLRGAAGAQVVIQRLLQRECFTVYCHPVWSRQTFAEIADLKGFRALEIYNYCCHMEDHTGFALYYWDAYLRQGRRMWGIATDDSHQKTKDYGGGWVVVNAATLTEVDILRALDQGSFYSSNGPSIEFYSLQDGKVVVHCSPAESIHFVAFERRGRSFHAENGRPLTEALHVLHGDEQYVRVEVVDARGKTAWTNPIFFS